MRDAGRTAVPRGGPGHDAHPREDHGAGDREIRGAPEFQHAAAGDLRRRGAAAGGHRDLRPDGVRRGAAAPGDWNPHGAGSRRGPGAAHDDGAGHEAGRRRATAKSDAPQETVDLADVWKKLDKRSTAWTLLVDDQAKVLTVSEYIERFQKQGVKINKDPMYYVGMLDQMVTQNPDMLKRPFWELLQMAAIMEYDFDNGMDKDLLAKHVLGQAGFEANKKRLSQ